MNAKIKPDQKFMNDLYCTTPIENSFILFSFIAPIVRRIYGEYEHKFLIELFSRNFTVDKLLNEGALIRPKGYKKDAKNQFYVPFCENFSI